MEAAGFAFLPPDPFFFLEVAATSLLVAPLAALTHDETPSSRQSSCCRAGSSDACRKGYGKG